ncbi:aldose epimerase family protein [Alteromonas oceanisediminis]|uniref:aldose epimerase family protein n=1 Tax=Alteromonas oceanisediminis TaxID=2836180 RepID=UPI001BDAC5F1|nr:aldose epimerase [Alteromonas oceanisediminis]MBT0586298.1 aldose epimerase [Alteromonas oceanisediminis]
MKTYTLKSRAMEITLTDFGARIIDWKVNLGDEIRPIILSYKKLEDYLDDPFYLGAFVGPYANRIKQGRVQKDQKLIAQLTLNDRLNHLHGGPNALDKKKWNVVDFEDNKIRLELSIEDGWNGYPGPIELKIDYELHDALLRLKFEVNALRATIAGPTSHCYFNLNSTQSQCSGLEQWLESNATHTQHSDLFDVSMERQADVKATQYNFDTPTLLSENCAFRNLDHNFLFRRGSQQTVLYSKNRDLSLFVVSSYPAAQYYAGCNLTKPFKPNEGVCIEPHFGANAPNYYPNYGLLLPGSTFKGHIDYTLVPLLNNLSKHRSF